MTSIPLLLVLLIFAALIIHARVECVNSKPIARIIKRYLNRPSLPVKENQAPWHVFIPEVRCSGALIHGRWVVTAASCFSQASDQESLLKFRVMKVRSDDGFTNLETPLFVRIGNHHVDVQSAGEDMIPVLEVIIYPKFNDKTLDGDLAILFLTREPILSKEGKINMFSRWLVLPDLNDTNYDRYYGKLTVTGWGHKSGSKNPFPVLHSDLVSLTFTDICNDTTNYNGLVSSNMICSEGLACSVDGGSPLVAQYKNLSKLLGVFSWGRSCALDKKQAVYTRLGSEILQWLINLIQITGKLRFLMNHSFTYRFLIESYIESIFNL